MSLVVPESENVARWAAVLVPAAAIAERIANTEFVPASMRNKPDVVTAAILYGDEIGVGPMQALQGIHIVEGRPQPSSELMRAMILRAGHAFTVHEATGTRVRVSGVRTGRPESERVTVEWTLDMARSAGLLGRKNWQTHPRAMLMARATGDLARWLFPDVVKGLGYVAEEVEQEPPELEPEAAPAEPRKPLQRRKRAPAVPKPREEDESPVTALESGPSVADSPPPVAPPTEPPKPPEGRPEYSMEDDNPLPEMPPPEPEAPAELPDGMAIGPGMMRALQAAMTRELGTVATRDERLAMLAAILGRPVPSSKTLTPDDGSKALDALGRIASGQLAWRFDDASTPDRPIIEIQAVPNG